MRFRATISELSVSVRFYTHCPPRMALQSAVSEVCRTDWPSLIHWVKSIRLIAGCWGLSVGSACIIRCWGGQFDTIITGELLGNTVIYFLYLGPTIRKTRTVHFVCTSEYN